jgi:hypothetical protein
MEAAFAGLHLAFVGVRLLQLELESAALQVVVEAFVGGDGCW